MKYTVYLKNTVSTAVNVEADSPDEAVDLAFDSNDMPGRITFGAFGEASVDDGEWEAFEVTDESGATVWEDPS